MGTLADMDLKGKRALIRVDFNVPMKNDGSIADDSRIQSALPTIQYALQQGAKVIVLSHFGRPKSVSPQFSLQPCRERLSELLGIPVTLAPDCIGEEVEQIVDSMQEGDVVLLENSRFHAAEEHPDKDPHFAEQLAKLGDLYINDAFGASHRSHTSIVALPEQFSSGKRAAGLLLQKEIDFLGNALLEPQKPFYALIGGSKISTKLGVLKSLLNKTDAIFIGGAMAFTFLKAQGKEIGDSLYEEDMLEEAQEILSMAQEKGVEICLPVDVVAGVHFANDTPFEVFDAAKGVPEGYQGLDVGDKTLKVWKEKLQQGKTILWNGPVGVFEFSQFAKGTEEIARILASLDGVTTIAGGGETIAALQNIHLADAFSHISTGGGACLEYIEHETLPGIKVLA